MKVAIGLGSSLGDRHAQLELALRKLDAAAGLRLLRASRFVRTPPMRGGAARGWFLNAVATFRCELTLEQLLHCCRELEATAGRRRARFWGDRPLDLDILLAEGQSRGDAQLQVPHPGIGERGFVLGPLLEVWPDAVDAEGRPYADLPRAPGPRPAPAGIARK